MDLSYTNIRKEGRNMNYKIHLLILGRKLSKRYYPTKHKMITAINTLKRKHIDDDYYYEAYEKTNNIWNIIKV
jgi:hypothetical protein